MPEILGEALEMDLGNAALVFDGGGSVTVDDVLSDTSENPVQNKVIKAALDGKGTYSKPSGGIPKTDLSSDVQTSLLPTVTETDNGKVLGVVDGAWAVKSDEGGSSVTVDDALSPTSTNPVQNKVVKAALDGKQDTLTAGQNVTISGNTISADVDSAEIASNVTGWLNANVNPVGSAVVVDSSLSIEGAAADAKATGDALNDKADTSQMSALEIHSAQGSANRCDMSQIIQNTSLAWNTGVESANTNKCLYYMDVTEGDTLYFWSFSNAAVIASMNSQNVAAFDANGNVVSSAGANTYVHSYTVPSGIARVGLIFNQNQLNSGWKFIVIVNDSEQPTSYEDYVEGGSAYYATDEFLQYADAIKSKEYSIPFSAYVHDGVYINKDGSENTSANFVLTDFYEIHETDLVSAAGYSYVNASTGIATAVVAFFDENQAMISCVFGESTGLVEVTEIPVPDGAKYVRFGANTANQSLLSFGKIKRQFTELLSAEEEKSESLPFTFPLINKSISVIGDSISQGEKATSRINDGYAGILRQLFSLEFGKKLNFGFAPFTARATNATEMVSLNSWSGWTLATADGNAIGGSSYATNTAGSTLEFTINHEFQKAKIAFLKGSGFGSVSLKQGSTTFGAVGTSASESGVAVSDAIDISSADFSQPFQIVADSAPCTVSGLVLIDDEDWWTFNNYGRSGAPASTFTGANFDFMSNADIVFYALGVNGNRQGLAESIALIKDRFSASRARKYVLDFCFYSPQMNNLSKKGVLKKFASEIGAEYIDIWSAAPKDSTRTYLADGFLNADGIHPTDDGHRFIAEQIAKRIGLSINSKGLAQDVLGTKYD